jgi:hypothetical protein
MRVGRVGCGIAHMPLPKSSVTRLSPSIILVNSKLRVPVALTLAAAIRATTATRQFERQCQPAGPGAGVHRV